MTDLSPNCHLAVTRLSLFPVILVSSPVGGNAYGNFASRAPFQDLWQG